MDHLVTFSLVGSFIEFPCRWKEVPQTVNFRYILRNSANHLLFSSFKKFTWHAKWMVKRLLHQLSLCKGKAALRH